MRLKRALQVIATIGETMARWPDGRWQIRGKETRDRSATWVTHATERGLLIRHYDGATTTENGLQDNGEWDDA